MGARTLVGNVKKRAKKRGQRQKNEKTHKDVKKFAYMQK